jgi:hypothetical protein
MQKLVLALMVVFSGQALAKDLNSSTVGRFSSYDGIFYSQVRKIEVAMEQYLERELNCKNVKICAYQIDRSRYNELTTSGRDNWFNGVQYDYYQLTLNASCSKSFKNFRFRTYFAMDWEETTELHVGFDRNGRRLKKKMKVDQEYYGNTRGSAEYSHAGCTDDLDI